MHPRLRWLLTGILGCVIGMDLAEAETSRANGVVAIGGNAEERDRVAVTAGVTNAARAAGWRLPAKLSSKESAGLLRCLDPGEPWGCIPGTVNAQGIYRALVVEAQKRQAEDGSPLVVLTAKLVVTRPHALVTKQKFCEHCTDDRLTETSSELAQQLLQELAVRIGRTVLVVKSTPSGARITLDGEPLGGTDATYNTYPGSHVVIVEKAGYLTQTVTIEAEDGKTAEVAVTLRESERSSVPTITEPLAKPSRVVPLTLAGVGVVGLGTGGILLYLGQQDGPDDKTLHRRATTLGIVAGVAGIAALATGAIVWWRGSGAGTPTVSAGSGGGATVGWMGSF
jgi:hypothetical protein